jgi:hypothetical protein
MKLADGIGNGVSKFFQIFPDGKVQKILLESKE